jgi:hypothetical protein
MSVKTSNLVDTRIEPQPEPVYTRIVGPRQNQYYKIPASGLSDSSVTFNNLTTLGVDRAYLDTFELEITAIIDFNSDDAYFNPKPDEWTLDSFPFAKCCEQARVNINGGAFFSAPLSYVRAKERYWCEDKLSACYENVCPIHKPHLQYEDACNHSVNRKNGQTTNDILRQISDFTFNTTTFKAVVSQDASTKDVTTADKTVIETVFDGTAAPTRLAAAQRFYGPSPSGLSGGTNNSIIRLGAPRVGAGYTDGLDYENYYWPSQTTDATEFPGLEKGKKLRVQVTWREPVFCSPFSSRIDATYGRPLYNITSMDLQFIMCPDLSNMVRLVHIHDPSHFVKSINVRLSKVQLCYQVMTIPLSVTKPPTTLVPYRRFVPYITDFPQVESESGEGTPSGKTRHISSGVYTWNEIPQAIWIFAAPSKALIQSNPDDNVTGGGMLANGNWSSNKAFAYITNVDISLANTTQILSTATPQDLYRIAKANGCCDSFKDWAVPDNLNQRAYGADNKVQRNYDGIGSVLRLIPGADIIIPDQDLIPAANANNMVFQVNADFIIPDHSPKQNRYALWLLFEYNGVASISPGQCEITMNPLGKGEIFASAPVVTATGESTDGTLEGSGWVDKAKSILGWLNQRAKETKIVSTLLKNMPWEMAKKIGEKAETLGYGEMASKRPRGGAVTGGAVMGLGDFT